LQSAAPGVHTVRAQGAGLATGFATVVVGGGSPVALSGPRSFRFSGSTDGTPFSWAASLGDDVPSPSVAGLTPGLAGPGAAAELAAIVDASPGLSASAAADVVTVDTVPPGALFRFWVDDFQATGGGGGFEGGLVLDDVTQATMLVDRQPGRNFPEAVDAFGTERTENIDAGDADNDGDLDVIVANGGDGVGQVDRIYINLGGLQGGTPGTFTEETAARFPGMPAKKSRDIDFADVDNDFDLDVFSTIYGTTTQGGDTSRSFRNQGGIQGGVVGYFLEDTDDFWGSLLSVPAGFQLHGGDVGPWRGFTCDCDFGDLDMDGDVDLFHSSYGPEMSGGWDSKIFLNDGTGRFDELWPWADPAADIGLVSLDVELVDLDGDFDLDIVHSSRDSQSRIYRNDLELDARSWPGDPFVDVTLSALIATGAAQSNTTCYEAEAGDVDGDGDFDLFMVNYDHYTDVLLRNDGGLVFTKLTGGIKQWFTVDEVEADFLDYDGDGDLDTFMANFVGTNRLFVNGWADGLDGDALGFLHLAGADDPGHLAPWDELPALGNGHISRDADAADLDGDGDPDLLLANDQNKANQVFLNRIGIPDTHAPTVELLTVQGDKSDGSDTILRAQLRDNAAWYVIDGYDVDLVWTLDGGFENRVAMASQGGQSFQVTLPGGVDGTISYRVEAVDQASNMVTTAPISFVQTSTGQALLLGVGEGTPGVFRRPRLDLRGTLVGGTTLSATLRDASPASLAAWFFSLSSTPLAFKGGLLHTVPVLDVPFVATNAGGQLHVETTWPGGLPAGVSFWTQFAVADGTALKGATLSNAVRATTP
jgi:hypothetical protein